MLRRRSVAWASSATGDWLHPPLSKYAGTFHQAGAVAAEADASTHAVVMSTLLGSVSDPMNDPFESDDDGEVAPGNNGVTTVEDRTGDEGRGWAQTEGADGGVGPRASTPHAMAGTHAGAPRVEAARCTTASCVARSNTARYTPLPFADVAQGMNIGRTRDAGRARATLSAYRAEAKRFATFLAFDDARALRTVLGDDVGLSFVTRRGTPSGQGSAHCGPASVDSDALFASPPPKSDVLIKAFLFDRSNTWTCSEDKMRKMCAALSREFELADTVGTWNGQVGNPVDSPAVAAARAAHKEKRARECISVKGVDPIRYRDLDRFFQQHFHGRDLREWDAEMVMLYTSKLVGMNLCIRFNELARLRYVSFFSGALHGVFGNACFAT